MMVAEEVPADYLFIGEAIVPPANWASFPPHRHDFDDLPYEVDMEEIYFFHPYLLGERSPYWDANLRGSFVGATMRHGKPHFVRALLEGVAYSLRDCYRSIVEMQLPVDEIRLIGGGAKSDLWTQIIGDVFAWPGWVSACLPIRSLPRSSASVFTMSCSPNRQRSASIPSCFPCTAASTTIWRERTPH
jgi:hypothetical protein